MKFSGWSRETQKGTKTKRVERRLECGLADNEGRNIEARKSAFDLLTALHFRQPPQELSRLRNSL